MSQDSRDGLLAASSRALREGRQDEAVALARKAVQAFPGNPGVLHALADALTQSGAFAFNPTLQSRLLADGSLAEAVEVLEQAVRISDKNHQWFLELGNGLTALRDYARAAKAIRRATDLYLPLAKPELTFGDMDTAPVLSPRFFVIGSVKCGTTSLFDYMTTHPDILPAVTKECHYFHHPERGLEWYLSHFPKRPAGAGPYVTGDFSASTINAHDAPSRLHGMVPGARLIALVRNPVDRAISHFHMNQRVGVEQRSLEAAMSEELEHLAGGEVSNEYAATQQSYLLIGLYARELERWLDVFPQEQLLPLVMEEMQRDPASAVADAFEHIGVRPCELHEFRRLNEGLYAVSPHTDVRRRLNEFFAGQNERFYELIGRRLGWEDTPGGAMRWAPLPAAARARSLAEQERWSEAAAAWRTCLTDAPEHPDALWWRQSMSDALLRAGDIDGAEAAFEELVRRDARSAPGREGLARTALARGNPREAAARLEQCIDSFPHHPNRRKWLAEAGHALVELRELDRAERMFHIIVTDYPGEGAGPAGLARIAQARQDDQRAITLWQDCLSRFPTHPDRQWWLQGVAQVLTRSGLLDRAEAAATTLVAEYPAFPAGLSCLADIASSRSDHAKAAEIWEDCIRRFPADANRRWWLVSAGRALLQIKQLTRAAAAFGELREGFPDEAWGYAGAALAARELGDGKRAAELWSSCLRRFPDSPERRWWLPSFLLVLIDLGDTQRAESIGDEIILEFPEEASALASLARLETHRRNLRLASELWDECLSRFPEDPDRLWWLLFAGQVHMDRQLPAMAEAAFRRVTEEFPGDARGWAGLAHAIGQQSRASESAALWRTCIAQFPDHPERSWWLPNYGHLLLDMGHNDEANKVFQRMSSEFPEDQAGISGLARAAYLRSDWQEASRLLDETLKRFPADPHRSDWAAMRRHAEDQLMAGRDHPGKP